MRDSNGVVSLGGAGSFHLNKEDIFETSCRTTKGILEEEEVKQGEGGSKPLPRTYVRGFGAAPLQGGRNIHPRAYARGVLWYGVNIANILVSGGYVNLLSLLEV